MRVTLNKKFQTQEYMFNLDSKLRQKLKLMKAIKSMKSSNNTSDLKEKSAVNANAEHAECYIYT